MKAYIKHQRKALRRKSKAGSIIGSIREKNKRNE